MKNVMGCIAPEKWWSDQRAKRRTVVLVIVLIFYIWLTAFAHQSVLEAAGLIVLIGFAAGTVIDRVVDGHRSGKELAALLQLADPGRP